MKLSTAFVLGITFVALGCGCRRATPFSRNSTTGLPKLELKKVIDSRLVQVGPKGEILTIQGEIGSNYSPIGRATYWSGYLEEQVNQAWQANPRQITQVQQTSPEQMTIGTAVSSVPVFTLLDDNSKQVKLLDDEVIREKVEGKMVAMRPLKNNSGKYRYYLGDGALYFRPIQSKDILLFDRFPSTAIVSVKGDEVLIEDGDQDAYRMHVPDKTKTVLKGSRSYKVQDFTNNGDVLLSQMFRGTKRVGKATINLQNANSAHFWETGGQTFVVGMAWSGNIDDGSYIEVPVFWNDQGLPVPIENLCPDFARYSAAITKYGNQVQFSFNKNGVMALCSEAVYDDAKPKVDQFGFSQPPSSQPRTFVFEIGK